MRLYEILSESTNESEGIVNDLSSLLTILSDKGETQVDTSYVVKILQSYGHNINADSIISIATQSPNVKAVNGDIIDIQDSEGTGGSADGEFNDVERDRQIVGDMAQDATDAAFGD